MAILWRQLLDAINVRWIDRGHNTAKGRVNIRCPSCGPRDPSFHLGIEETTGWYNCLRATGHGGKSPYWLLMKLDVPSFQIDALLRDYSDDSAPLRAVRQYEETTNWEKLASAAEHPAALKYLRERGLDPPAVLARRYDMRFTTVGRHAWRILLPLQLNFSPVGWTGRAIRAQQDTPRYLTNDSSGGASLYVPVWPGKMTKTIVIVEGPFDAIAIADAYYPTHEVTAIAVTGLNVSPPRRQHLADVIELAGQPRVLLTLDADQGLHPRRNFNDLLAKGTNIPHPENFPLPPGVKDAGEMTRSQIRTWLD